MNREKLINLLKNSCAKREYSSGQIRQKIERFCKAGKYEGGKVLSADEISQILDLLKGEKFIDDSRFASFYVRDKARFNNWGKVKISSNLRLLGISDNIIEVALSENIGLFGGENLMKLMEKKWNSLKDGDSIQTKKAKVLRFALSRGYEWGEIMPLLNKLG